MSSETFMLTGSMGCIGAWTLRNLVREGVRVVATDLATDPMRPRQVMSAEELSRVEFAKLDVTDLNAVKKMVADQGIGRRIVYRNERRLGLKSEADPGVSHSADHLFRPAPCRTGVNCRPP